MKCFVSSVDGLCGVAMAENVRGVYTPGGGCGDLRCLHELSLKEEEVKRAAASIRGLLGHVTGRDDAPRTRPGGQ
jgi:hypothetical protein